MHLPRALNRRHVPRLAGRVSQRLLLILVGFAAVPLLLPALGGPVADVTKDARVAAGRGLERIEAGIYDTLATLLAPERLVRALDGRALPDFEFL